MGTLNYAGFNGVVANHVGMTTGELPQTSLDQWYREITDRIVAKDNRWPFLRRSGTFNTVASQQEYGVAALDSELLHVTSMWVDGTGGRELSWIGEDTADRRYRISSSESNPYYWTEQTDSSGVLELHLFPTPSAIETISYRAFKRPDDWATLQDTPELPVEFDQVIIDWAVGRLYMQQEMPTMGERYMALALDQLKEIHATYRHSPGDSVLVYGNDERRWDSPVFRSYWYTTGYS